MRGFASDNYAGVHPRILSKLSSISTGHFPAYGGDPVTHEAQAKLSALFGGKAEVFFVSNGTSANVLSLSSLCKSHQAVLCSEHSHIAVDECGAPEKWGGFKLILVSAPDGKVTIDALEQSKKTWGPWKGVEHHVQAGMLSVAQTTEYGTVYSRDELAGLSEWAHRHGMFFHVDGARISNALCALKTESFESLITLSDVDVISFGGTKNGLMFGEAVIFPDPEKSPKIKEAILEFPFLRKQAMQLQSKSRFIAGQFLELFGDTLWRENASHANEMAKKLEERLIPLCRGEAPKITRKVEANAVFIKLSNGLAKILQSAFPFYLWKDLGNEMGEYRLMTSFDTQMEEIEKFAILLKSKT